MGPQVSHAPTSHTRSDKALRVLVVGNTPLQADALTYFLTMHCDDFHLLSPLYGIDQVVPYLHHAEPVDVILLLFFQLPDEVSVFRQLQLARQRCLLVSCVVPTPYLVSQIKEAGVWGILEATCSLADLSSAIRSIASGRKHFPEARFSRRRTAHLSLSRIQRTSLKPSHQVIFAPRVLEECAQAIGWTLTEQDRAILGHFFEGTEEMAKTMSRPASLIRHVISVRSYDFLSLLANAPVRDRAAACRTLLAWGIHQVIESDPAQEREKTKMDEREDDQPPGDVQERKHKGGQGR